MTAHPQRLGRYEVVSELAHGGMAELFIAKLPGIEGFAKRVVIKRVLPALARDREFVEMFLQEARLAATLDHQNIVQVHDIGHDAGGYFFAMELLHGDDVGHVMTAAQGKLPLDIAVEIARCACAGLHYAHERSGPTGAALGLVHRDISPQNLFVTFDGAVKLLDFGIAKAAQRISNHYTRSGTLRGKIPYMAPEQCQNEPLDRRSDVFSLAVVLWEMTVGARLFGADGQSDFEILKSIVDHDAPAPSSRKPGYPPALERIVMKGLRRARADRYQTADEMQADLEAYIRDHGRWVSTRDMAAFVAQVFPDRAAAWRWVDRDAVETSPGGELVPFPVSPRMERATLELPADRNTEKDATRDISRPNAVEPRKRWRWLLGAVGLAGVALTVGILVGRGSGATSSPAPSAKPAPVAALPDDHGIDPDDYLISKSAPEGARTNSLRIAKLLAPPVAAGQPAKFLDGRGVETETKHYWKTRIATPADLALGSVAFCMADDYDNHASTPKDRKSARGDRWMMARVSDAGTIDKGTVIVGNVTCPVAGVRVPVE